MVSECERVNLFNTKEERKVRVPLEFKILISLRILGRGNCFDDIAELSRGYESSCHKIFHDFINAFHDHFYEQYVNVPTGQRMEKVKRMYEQLGIPWDKCP